MILYRLAKWMEDQNQEQEQDRNRDEAAIGEWNVKTPSSVHSSSKNSENRDNLPQSFPMMKEAVAKFQERVPYQR